MYPTSIALPYQLSKLDAALQLHLLDEFEQAAVIGLVPRNNISSTAKHVVTILHTPYERVELLATVATTDHNRLAPRFAYGV